MHHFQPFQILRKCTDRIQMHNNISINLIGSVCTERTIFVYQCTNSLAKLCFVDKIIVWI